MYAFQCGLHFKNFCEIIVGGSSLVAFQVHTIFPCRFEQSCSGHFLFTLLQSEEDLNIDFIIDIIIIISIIIANVLAIIIFYYYY